MLAEKPTFSKVAFLEVWLLWGESLLFNFLHKNRARARYLLHSSLKNRCKPKVSQIHPATDIAFSKARKPIWLTDPRLHHWLWFRRLYSEGWAICSAAVRLQLIIQVHSEQTICWIHLCAFHDSEIRGFSIHQVCQLIWAQQRPGDLSLLYAGKQRSILQCTQPIFLSSYLCRKYTTFCTALSWWAPTNCPTWKQPVTFITQDTWKHIIPWQKMHYREHTLTLSRMVFCLLKMIESIQQPEFGSEFDPHKLK